MKKIILTSFFFSLCLSAFSQIKVDLRKNKNLEIAGIKPETPIKDTIFHKISYEQFLHTKRKYDSRGIAFYYYSGCCSFGDVGGKIPKITEVFIAKEPNGNEHKLITGNKPGFF